MMFDCNAAERSMRALREARARGVIKAGWRHLDAERRTLAMVLDYAEAASMRGQWLRAMKWRAVVKGYCMRWGMPIPCLHHSRYGSCPCGGFDAFSAPRAHEWQNP